MKKIIAILGLFMFSLNLSAQNYYYYNGIFPSFPGSNNKSVEIQKIKDNHVKSKSIYYKNARKKDSAYLSEVVKYNTNGNISKITHYNSKGKQTYSISNSYNSDNKSVIYKYIRKNRILTWVEYSYTSSGKLEDYVTKNKKGDTIYHTKNIYNEDKISEIIKWKKGKLKKRITYDYYPNGDKKTVNYYDKNGKLTKVYSYECSDEGKVVGKKDTTKVCKIEDYNSEGIKVVTYTYTNEKGKTSRRVNKYKNDSLLISSVVYRKNGSKSYENVYEYAEDTTKSYYYKYKRNGKQRYLYLSVFDSEKNIIRSENQWRHTKYLNKYYYSEKGLLQRMTSYDKKGLSGSSRYEYSFY